MKNLKLILFMLPLFSFVACQNNPVKEHTEETKDQEVKEVAEVAAEVIEVYVEDTEDREPLDEELNEFGLVSLVEDSGYPFYYLLIEFSERQMEAYFHVNKEDLNFEGSSLEALKGQYISFYYEIEEENSLSDMLFGGVSVFGEDAYRDDEMKSATGLLTEASEVSQGDLPGSFNITTGNDEILEFEYYITEEMVAVNNKNVIVYYSERGRSRITYIRKSE